MALTKWKITFDTANAISGNVSLFDDEKGEWQKVKGVRAAYLAGEVGEPVRLILDIFPRKGVDLEGVITDDSPLNLIVTIPRAIMDATALGDTMHGRMQTSDMKVDEIIQKIKSLMKRKDDTQAQ